ncbi:MAG: carboxypeptidase regulatory-like domain-containing protein, partial [Bacteroidetes bacterium]|nr:carboxypeptidase regulatory-like domain-containing protein [Bacteroidota bacterium]
MKNLTTLILLLSALLVAPIAKATHVMGADISYTCDSAKAYTFRLTYYRSCKGVPFSNPTKETRIRQANGSSVASVSLSLISISDITPVCSKSGNPCNPKNTYGAGNGIEAHVYETKINFNTSPYNALLSGGSQCEFILETSLCCRNSDITTGSANQNFYTYVKFDVCLAPVNNSPQFLTPPIGMLCCNQPVYTQVGATDYYDNDSLAYKFAHPLKAWNSNIGYSGKYTHLKPFKAYDPTGKGTVNPNARPPIGIYLDSENGDLIFTPTKCDEITVAVLEVEEWRKDTSGTYQLISTSRRDMQFVTKTCAGNNAPILDPPYSFKIKSTPCQISQGYCFTITTDDKVKIPPPPQSIPPPDSVKFDMLSLPPGVSMNIVSPKALHQSARVCLDLNQINLADYVNKPLRIIAQVNDNNCPLMGVTQRVYSVFFDTTVAEGRIFGQIQNDTNLNCQLDTGEGKHLHPRKMGMKTDKLKYFTTHPDGTFGLCTDTGLHVFKLLPSAWYEQACDTIHVYVPKDSTRYVNLHSKIKPGIAGYVYKDSDSCINSGKPIPFQQLKLTPGNHVVTTDLNGFFLFPVSPGTYTVRLINDTSSFVANCATTFQLTLNANETAYTDDFLLKPIPRSDLNVSVVYNSGSTVRKGDDCYAVIKVENIGTKAIDTTFISAILPSGLVDSAKSTAGWDSLGGGQFSRRVLHLQPKQSYHFRLYLKTSSLNTRDTIWCRVQSDSAVLLEDTDHSNNRDEKQLKVVAPYDPNIKSATPDSIFTVDNRELVYTVEFQNEGTANAIQVFIL